MMVHNNREGPPFRYHAGHTTALILLLAGCAQEAGRKPSTWSRPGATYDDHFKDHEDCFWVRSAKDDSGYISIHLFRACMQLRGWVPDPDGFGPPTG
jgi:hypothetical protein